MWTCGLLKQNARIALTGRYWRCFLVCLVLGLLGAGGATYTAIYEFRTSLGDIQEYFNPPVWTGNNVYTYSPYSFALDLVGDLVHSLPLWLLLLVLGVFIISLLITTCWNAFLVNPLLVGRARYFMESRQAISPYGTVTTVFRHPYLNVVKVQFLTSLKILLGSLVVVPGIYWAFCYRQVPYLLAENPYLTTRRAMQLSRDMMYGEKWHCFLLDLSFIGWKILCGFTLGIGYLFLEPYVQATDAELYAALRTKAMSHGLTGPGELGGFVRHSSWVTYQ